VLFDKKLALPGAMFTGENDVYGIHASHPYLLLVQVIETTLWTDEHMVIPRLNRQFDWCHFYVLSFFGLFGQGRARPQTLISGQVPSIGNTPSATIRTKNLFSNRQALGTGLPRSGQAVGSSPGDVASVLLMGFDVMASSRPSLDTPSACFIKSASFMCVPFHVPFASLSRPFCHSCPIR